MALPLPYFNFKPKQPYPLYIIIPGFHCRLCSAHLLLLCWGNMQSQKVVMSLMVSFAAAWCWSSSAPLWFSVSHSLWGSLTVPQGCHCSVLSGHTPSGCLCHSTSGRSPVAMEPLLPRAHLQPHVPSVSLSNHGFLCLLSLLSGSLCLLQQEYSVLPRPVESFVLLEFGIFPIASFSRGILLSVTKKPWLIIRRDERSFHRKGTACHSLSWGISLGGAEIPRELGWGKRGLGWLLALLLSRLWRRMVSCCLVGEFTARDQPYPVFSCHGWAFAHETSHWTGTLLDPCLTVKDPCHLLGCLRGKNRFPNPLSLFWRVCLPGCMQQLLPSPAAFCCCLRLFLCTLTHTTPPACWDTPWALQQLLIDMTLVFEPFMDYISTWTTWSFRRLCICILRAAGAPKHVLRLTEAITSANSWQLFSI